MRLVAIHDNIYRRLMGNQDSETQLPGSAHCSRPHEIPSPSDFTDWFQTASCQSFSGIVDQSP
jgi:hypothetical protein